MKIAIITPYYQEDAATLNRCCNSVVSQTYKNLQHIMVADGDAHPLIKQRSNVDHIILPRCHNDAGATPRAIGAISAFSQGCDAVAFLDVDNTLEPNHIELMKNLIDYHDVITATRHICTRTGEKLFVDTVESNGNDFCDTNCLFLTRSVLPLLTYWITDPGYRLLSDRQFWLAILQTKLKRTHCTIPTVNYYSRWAWHYQHAGQVPPSDSVWLGYDQNGQLTTNRHINILQ
jgi:glycosyltransferase involved in cell wall biosynthesis